MTSLVNNQQDDFEPDDFTPETDDFVADDFEPDAPKKKTTNDLSWWDKNFTQEGQELKAAENRNFVKSIASGITAGFSEMIPGLNVDEDLPGSTIGKVGGSLLPLGLATKAI